MLPVGLQYFACRQSCVRCADHRWVDRSQSLGWFLFLVLLWFDLSSVICLFQRLLFLLGSVNRTSAFDHLFITSLRHLNLCQLEIEIDATTMPLGIVLYGRNYVNLFPSRFSYLAFLDGTGSRRADLQNDSLVTSHSFLRCSVPFCSVLFCCFLLLFFLCPLFIYLFSLWLLAAAAPTFCIKT